MLIMENFEFRLIPEGGHAFKFVLERWEEGVAFDFALNEGQEEVGAKREGLFVHLGTAGDEEFQGRTSRVELEDVLDNTQVHGRYAAQLGEFKLMGPVRNLGFAAAHPGAAEHFGKITLQPAGVPAQNNVDTMGQRFAQAFKGFAPHDDHVARGQLLEPFEILRQMPWDLVAGADDAVLGHGGDGFEMFHRYKDL